MTVPYGDFESRLLDLIDRASFTATLGSVQNQRLVLGGTRGSGGGEGGPIQPFIGKLPQTEVTFDTDEFATLTIPSGETASLLDNLNRIRVGWTIVPSGVDEQNYTVAGSGNLVEHLRGIDDALGSGWGYTIQDEGITLPRRHRLNFIGASVVAEDNLGDDATDVTISVSGGGGGHTIQDEGGDLTQRTNLNFAGPTVVATDDVGNDATLVTISGSAGWPYSDSVISVDPTDPDADYTTLALAVAAAVSGDTIVMGPGTHTVDNVTLPDGVHLVGFGMGVTELQATAQLGCITGGDGSIVMDLIASSSYSAAGVSTTIRVGSGDTTQFIRVKGVTANGSDTSYGFYLLGSAVLIDCEASCPTFGRGVGVDANCEIRGGKFDGADADVYGLGVSADLLLVDPILVNSDVAGAAWSEVTGWYLNPDGDRVAEGSVVLRGSDSDYPDIGTTTVAEKAGHVYSGPGKDHWPDDDRRGFARRFVAPVTLSSSLTDHFRSGVIPGGFAWQGAPFIGTPATVNYNYRNEYLRTYGTGAGQRAFMSTAITNAAGSWQNKYVYGRFTTGATKEVGLRVDDGGDNNYAEAYVNGVAGDGTISLTFRYRTGGGGVTTVASNIVVPAGTLLMFLLRNIYSGGNYSFGAYIFGETADAVNVTGFGTGVVGWAPAAGRVGIFIKNGGNPGYCDWIYKTFT